MAVYQRTLWVSGLSPKTTTDDLKYFLDDEDIDRILLVKDAEGRGLAGVAYVVFQATSSVTRAIGEKSGHKLHNRKLTLRVTPAELDGEISSMLGSPAIRRKSSVVKDLTSNLDSLEASARPDPYSTPPTKPKVSVLEAITSQLAALDANERDALLSTFFKADSAPVPAAAQSLLSPAGPVSPAGSVTPTAGPVSPAGSVASTAGPVSPAGSVASTGSASEFNATIPDSDPDSSPERLRRSTRVRTRPKWMADGQFVTSLSHLSEQKPTGASVFSRFLPKMGFNRFNVGRVHDV